jgi:transcriptional regulator with XRE-family HTH domain
MLFKKAIALVVRELRKEKGGLTQEKLSEISTLDYKYIQSIERGVKNPSLETILKLSKAFEMTASDFVSLIEQRIQILKNSQE